MQKRHNEHIERLMTNGQEGEKVENSTLPGLGSTLCPIPWVTTHGYSNTTLSGLYATGEATKLFHVNNPVRSAGAQDKMDSRTSAGFNSSKFRTLDLNQIMKDKIMQRINKLLFNE